MNMQPIVATFFLEFNLKSLEATKLIHLQYEHSMEVIMNIEIANRLQKLRKEKGLSQEQLAEELGVSRQAVSKWERAESSPDTDNLICLAKLYGISLDELLSTDQSFEELKKEQAEKENKKENVHISFKGIDVESKEGDKVHVGWDGIHVHSKNNNEHVDIDADGIKIKHQKSKYRLIKSIINAVVAISCLIMFILVGFMFNLWNIAWIIFFLIPIITSIIEAIEKRRFTIFSYPLLVVMAYLFIGMKHSLWHPYWFLFLTIPLYYIVFSPIDKAIHSHFSFSVSKNSKDDPIIIDLNEKD